MERGSLLGNSVWLILEKATRLAAGLYVGVQTARFLGADGLGTWNYYLTIYTFFSVFASLGIDFITPREYAAYPHRKNQIMGVTIILKTGGATLAILLSLLFILIIKGFDKTAVLLLLCISTGYLFQAFDSVEYYFNSRLKSRYSVMARIIAFLIISGYKIALVYFKCQLFWFVLSSTLEFFLGALLLLYFLKLKDEFGRQLFTFDKFMALKILRDALPFSAAALMTAVYYRIDQFMITEMIDATNNGIYSVAVRMNELFIFVPTAMVISFLPVFISARTKNEEAGHEIQLQLYTILSWMAFAATIFTLLLGPWLMEVLYGEGFNGSGAILQVISLGFYPVFISLGIGNLLVVRNLSKINLFKNGAGLVANVSLNLWLIPRYGITGAAVATVVSQFVALGAVLVFRDSADQLRLLLRAFNPVYFVRFSINYINSINGRK